MNQLLEQAFQKVSELPEEDQYRIARFLLGELNSERRWDDLLSRSESEDLLEHLADEALADHRAGRTTPLDFEDF